MLYYCVQRQVVPPAVTLERSDRVSSRNMASLAREAVLRVKHSEPKD